MLKRRTVGRLAAALVVAALAAACEPTNQGYEPRQPIAYSHAVHAGDLKIPCLYCHYAAARGRHAGIPPLQICMNCHTQVKKDAPEIVKIKRALAEGTPVEWVRVHRLPSHAKFDHSVHVAADVACQTCHGPVQEMGRIRQNAPLTMGWCISCHREKGAEEVAKGIVPASSSGRPDRANRLTDCSVCHH